MRSIKIKVAAAAVATAAAAGIGFGAYSIGSASGEESLQVARSATTGTVPEARNAPGTGAPDSPLTLEKAKAVATEAAPGRVIEWDEDHEPTGLRYDVTLLHDDGTTTEVEVDTVTGQVTSIDHDDDRD